MLLRNKNFFLSLDIECADSVGIDFYNSDISQISTSRRQDNDSHHFEMQIELPSKLVIAIKNRDNSKAKAKLNRIRLAGLDIQKDSLLRILDYYDCPGSAGCNTLDEIVSRECQKTLCWGQGYVIINFFHPDPFAWHLYIDNKIKFKI